MGKKSTSLYQKLFQQSKDAIFIVNAEGYIRNANKAFLKLFGLTRKSLRKQMVANLVNDANELAGLTEALQKEGDVHDFPLQIFHKDGRVLETLLNMSVIHDDDGNIQDYLGTVSDITEQKATAESITILNRIATVLHSSLEFETVVNQATDLIMTYANAPTAALFTADEAAGELKLVVGKGFSEETLQVDAILPIESSFSGAALTQRKILTSDDIGSSKRAADKVRQSLAKEGLQGAISVPLLYQDRALGIINLLFKEKLTLQDEQREILLAIGRTVASAMANAQYVAQVEEQIQERKKAEINLVEQENLLQIVLNTIPQAVFWKDRQSVYLGGNRNFIEGAGIGSAEELIGKTDHDFWSKKQARDFIQIDKRVMKSNSSELGLIERQGEAWVETNKVPLHDADGDVIGVLGTYEDITGRMELQAQVETSVQLLNRQLEISQVLAQAQTETDILDTIVDQAGYYPQVAISLTLIETAGDELVDVVVAQNSYESGLTLTPIGRKRPHSKNPLDKYYSAEKSFIAGNISTDKRLPIPDRKALKTKNMKSMAILPLTSGGNWLGSFTLISQEEDFFDEQALAIYQTMADQGAIALRAARLYAETQISLTRREREVILSTQIAQGIASATDLDDLYQRIVTQIQEQFGYYYTQLLRYDPAMQTVALTVGYGEVGDKMLALNHSMPIGVGLIGKAAAVGASILRPNLANDPDWRANPLLPKANGELAVPIKLGNEVLGVLDVQSSVADELNENDQLVLEGLCGQIAVAIESTMLRQDMEARLRELNALQRQMSREGWQEYQSAKQQVNGYQFTQAGVQMLDESVFSGAQLEANRKQNGQTAVALTDNKYNAPLQIRGETIGVLGVQDDDNQALAPEEQEFLWAVSKEVAEALEAARLFEQTQNALAEQERLTSELETVAQVSTAASTILEADALLQAVVDLAKTSFNLYHVHIYLLNESSSKLILKAGAGNIGRLMTLEGREIGVEAESLVARAVRTRQGIIENNVRRTIDFLPHPLLPQTQSEMAIPMIMGDKIIGVLDLQANTTDKFTQEDLKIQRTLASQIAIAVENARQYAAQVETSAKLREVDRLKSEFLASMSHELRTPLNSIIGFADVILEGLDGPLNERMEEDVYHIRESGRHLRELIGDILDMSKIEAGRMELRYEEINLHQMAQDIMATAQPLVQEKSLDMYLDLDEQVITIQADRTRLRQVLWNIMGNAIKFTEKGSVSLSIQDRGTHVLLAIRDTGIGIKEENIGVVFEQFRQIDGGLNRTVGGTGLGMPITKKLVTIHGGDIWVESVVGQGSTFFFTLPYVPPILKDTGPLPDLG
ncbi:MAG: GAF domain-containing protein [Chloroflexi bacterium]|nr:GAF domain-containing protein [Chloroflexota bacterium]